MKRSKGITGIAALIMGFSLVAGAPVAAAPTTTAKSQLTAATTKHTSLAKNLAAKQAAMREATKQLTLKQREATARANEAELAAPVTVAKRDAITSQQAAAARDEVAAQAASAKLKAQAAALQKTVKTLSAQVAATKQQVTTLQTKVTTAAAAARTTKVATKAKAATPAKSATVATGSLTGIGAAAAKYLGTPYRAGGASPTGFDCSGLVWYAAKQIGVSLPRTAGGMSTRGQAVSLSHLKAGDLLFWGGVGSAYHVAIYIGGGRYIHSPQPGQSVRIQSMGSYGPSFARRL